MRTNKKDSSNRRVKPKINIYPIKEILEELERAAQIHPYWPNRMLESVSIITEEMGELAKAANDYVLFGHDKEKSKTEAIQLAAMAIRFLMNFEKY